MSVSHALYGLHLAASQAIPGLPLLPDSKETDVRIRLKERPAFLATSPALIEILYASPEQGASGGPILRFGVLPGGKYFGFSYSDGAQFAVQRQGREIWADWPEAYTLEDACTYLLGPVMGFVLRLRGVTCLHASSIAFDDRAIALLGLPGAGKSTTAAAFARSGFSVLSDDVVALVDGGSYFLVQPGYPRVNLWPDSVRALFGSADALPRITPTWDKRYIALGQNGHRFASRPLPLGAIYILGAREAALTSPVIEEVKSGDAFIALVANTYVSYLLDREMRSHEFDVLSRAVAEIPVRRVRPAAEPSALFDLCETITADAKLLMAPASMGMNFGQD